MDRELVLAILVALLCGGALTATACWPTGSPMALSGRALEQRAWRTLWLPFVPATLLLAALCGWALREPESAERVPNCLLLGAVPFTAVLLRAAWRGARTLVGSRSATGMATVGLLRPRILVSAEIAERLDGLALAAALAHERAHARHRDPLRLWLAQLGSDLLWPWPAAGTRLLSWRRALELARDEEARLSGVAGADLAAAILTVLRVSRVADAPCSVSLGGEERFFEERVARLMQPLHREVAPLHTGTTWSLAVLAGVTLAILLGSAFGERVVQTLLTVV